ncbi:hypothetical protein [Massilia sp. TWR1-2-2]|uniref:hypothetical protein n=1 Tax=Massilia sp. TWR1-2-2 TaxID=2804584 RepID=UPI003CFAE90C
MDNTRVLIALTVAIIYLLPKLTTAVPSALVAIFAVAGIVAAAGIDTKTVGDMGSIAGGLPAFHLPQVRFTLGTFYVIAPYSLILAAIGLIESPLTLNLVDEITAAAGSRTRNRWPRARPTSSPACSPPWAAAP